MANVFYWSDLHLGHKNVVKWRLGYGSIEEHDEYIFNRLIAPLGKRDTLFLLGDVTFSAEALEKINSIDCFKKVLILGNHETDHRRGFDMSDLVEVYDEIHGLYKKHSIWFSHAPIHPDELRGMVNVHGHMHEKTVDDERYLNVCVEQFPNGPIDLNEVRRRLNYEKKQN